MATVANSLLAFGVIVCALGSADFQSNNVSNVTELIASPVQTQVASAVTRYTIIQTLEMTSLDDYLNTTALKTACKAAVVVASDVPDPEVLTLIEKVKVTLTLCFSSPAASASTLREAIARQAGVSIDAVDVKHTTQRRLRRLSTSVLADIDASLSTPQDGVQAAAEIHTLVQDRLALQSVLSNKAGMEVNLSSVSVAVNVKMRSTITANISIGQLQDDAFAERVGQAIGGNVTTQYVANDVESNNATSSAPVVTSTSTVSDGTSMEALPPLSLAYRSAYPVIGVLMMTTSWNAFA